MQGYDLDFIRRVSDAVNISVIACGGARTVDDLVAYIKQGGASAASAGSIFVFQGTHRAVLISYPSYGQLQALFEGVDDSADNALMQARGHSETVERAQYCSCVNKWRISHYA